MRWAVPVEGDRVREGEMMGKNVVEVSEGVAEAVRMCKPEVMAVYPITPQTEVLEHISERMPEEGRVFLQAESEVASINMVYGAASAGARVMTSSSSAAGATTILNVEPGGNIPAIAWFTSGRYGSSWSSCRASSVIPPVKALLS